MGRWSTRRRCIVALRDGVIAGAALDVFDTEPLPSDHPLWSMPNVIITPHGTGRSAGTERRATAMFLDNFERYVRGEPLQHLAAI